ncbi:MAG: sugar ABC transporter permease [Spirochaetales bacterium]|nr:sugar ABC transporter permease [Spirochaetales bacterium]
MKKNEQRGDRIFGAVLLVPSILIVGGFIFLPVIQSLYYSFFDYKLTRKKVPLTWNSFGNYRSLWESGKLQHAFSVTFQFMVIVVVLVFLLGLVMALLLNRGGKGERAKRTLALLPWGTPTVIVALLWSWMFQPEYGVVNFFLLKLHLVAEPISFLVNPNTALGSVAVAAVWKQLPFLFIMLLAGLQGVPSEMYEAAHIDGAPPLRVFWHITLPFLRNVIRSSILVTIITNFKQFPLFWTMTGGGPMGRTETLAVLAYKNAFVNLNFGAGAAVAASWMAALIIFSLIYNRVFREAEY